MTVIADKPLLRRIKRHVSGRVQSFFAATAPGLESLCYQELTSILASDAEIVSGGVEFKGRLPDAYSANLDLRIPGRILMRIAGFKASNFRQLEKQVDLIPWELYINPETSPRINVKTVHSRLYHTSAISDRFKQSIITRLTSIHRKYDIGGEGATIQNLFVRAIDDRFTVSLDSSGEILYKRGLKTGVGKAPLRETLAVAALTWAGYTGKEPLIDPMCGAGTFALEAALISNRIPPGWYRDFSFMNWPAFKEKQWRHLKKQRSKQITRPAVPNIFASDIDPQVCTSLESIARQSDLSDTISVAEADFFHLNPAKICRQAGIVTLNPPFGIRLGSIRKSHSLYTEIAEKLKKDYRKWRVAIFLSDKRVIQKFPADLKRRTLVHGGLDLTLLTGRIQ